MIESMIVDTTGWTQEEINTIHAATSSGLSKKSITHSGISISNTGTDEKTVNVTDPSSTISVFTPTQLKTEIDSIIADRVVADQAAAVETGKRETEYENSELKSIDIDAVDTKIDAITNLADAKVFLKKLVRYLVARNLL